MYHNNLPTTYKSQNIDWDTFQRYVTLQLHQSKKEYDGVALIEISKFLGLQYKNKCFYNQKTWISLSQELSKELKELIKKQINFYHWDHIRYTHIATEDWDFNLLITWAETSQLLRKILADTRTILTKDYQIITEDDQNKLFCNEIIHQLQEKEIDNSFIKNINRLVTRPGRLFTNEERKIIKRFINKYSYLLEDK